MNKDENKPTKMCGLTLVQSKAVQKESSEWMRAAHPRFVIYKRLTLLAVILGTIGWILNLHPVMPLVALVPLMVYLIAIDKLLKEYDKQAPEELKVK